MCDIVKVPGVNLMVDKLGNVYDVNGIKRKLQDYGYYKVAVNRKHYAVHRLVAKTFIDNPDNKPIINHINGDRKDNRVENLEWVDASENMQKASIAGSLVHQKKKVDIYDAYGEFVTTIDSVAQTAKMFDMTPPAISSNIRRESFTKGYWILPHGNKPTHPFFKITGC